MGTQQKKCWGAPSMVTNWGEGWWFVVILLVTTKSGSKPPYGAYCVKLPFLFFPGCWFSNVFLLITSCYRTGAMLKQCGPISPWADLLFMFGFLQFLKSYNNFPFTLAGIMSFKEQCLYWHNYFRTLHQVIIRHLKPLSPNSDHHQISPHQISVL